MLRVRCLYHWAKQFCGPKLPPSSAGAASPSAGAADSVLLNNATQTQQTNPNNLPGFDASQTAPEAAPAAKDAKQATPAKEQKAAPANAPKPADKK